MKSPKRSPATNKEEPRVWEILDPSGAIERKTAIPAPRLRSLQGKTILLRWNFKHNGNLYLDRIAELLTEQVPGINLVKIYEIDRSTINQSGSLEDSARLAKIIAAQKPDLVIGAHGD
jgi:hypothetical protein